MAKKTSVKSKTRTTVKNSVKSKARKTDRAPKLAERIVPIPPIATYSELPFGRMETSDQLPATAVDSSPNRKSAIKTAAKTQSRSPVEKIKSTKVAKAKKRS